MEKFIPVGLGSHKYFQNDLLIFKLFCASQCIIVSQIVVLERVWTIIFATPSRLSVGR
jgi:hypothetical protein